MWPEPAGKRTVQCRALAFPFAGLVGGAGAGIPGRLMRAEVEDRSIAIEDILRAVTVVDVPIDDRHLGDPVLLLRVARGDGDIIKQAETHAAIGRGMMAGRPHGAERVGCFAFNDGIHRV